MDEKIDEVKKIIKFSRYWEGRRMDNYRNTWAEIDMDAIGYNVQQLKQLLPEGRKVMAVVKADGYGHGSVQVAQKALDEGVDFLMVALLEEAVKLRDYGIKAPILVIGRVSPTHAKVAADLNITLTIFDAQWLKEIKEEDFNSTLTVHVEFETGMNRTGICTKEELNDIINEVNQLTRVQITGAYTHFATADEISSSHFEKQRSHYEEMLQLLTDLYPHPLITHVGNSAAGIQYPKNMLHYTRFGVSTYGLYPSSEIRQLKNVELKQAFSLYSELIQVKRINAGEVVGYGATYTAKEDEWVGTIPIGYADGWRRSLQGFYVLVEGKKMPIIGRVCMDVMMVKLDQSYEVGQKVTLIGEDNGAVIEVDDVANYIDTINYEVPCMLTKRVPRFYK